MATEAAAVAGEATEKLGMPQLDFSTYPNQIFWLLITLVAIYLILSKVALPRIREVLAERAGIISNDLSAAEELRQKAVAAEKAYNDALARARIEAARIVSETKAEIQKDLNAAIAKADADISARSADSDRRIAEIQAGANDAITLVARDTAGTVVTAFGGRADADEIAVALSARLKG